MVFRSSAFSLVVAESRCGTCAAAGKDGKTYGRPLESKEQGAEYIYFGPMKESGMMNEPCDCRGAGAVAPSIGEEELCHNICVILLTWFSRCRVWRNSAQEVGFVRAIFSIISGRKPRKRYRNLSSSLIVVSTRAHSCSML